MLAANVVQEMQKDILGFWVYSIVLRFCVLFCFGGGVRFSGYCSLHDMQGKYLKSSVEEGLDFSRSWLLFSIRSSHDLTVHADAIPR